MAEQGLIQFIQDIVSKDIYALSDSEYELLKDKLTAVKDLYRKFNQESKRIIEKKVKPEVLYEEDDQSTFFGLIKPINEGFEDIKNDIRKSKNIKKRHRTSILESIDKLHQNYDLEAEEWEDNNLSEKPRQKKGVNTNTTELQEKCNKFNKDLSKIIASIISIQDTYVYKRFFYEVYRYIAYALFVALAVFYIPELLDQMHLSIKDLLSNIWTKK